MMRAGVPRSPCHRFRPGLARWAAGARRGSQRREAPRAPPRTTPRLCTRSGPPWEGCLFGGPQAAKAKAEAQQKEAAMNQPSMMQLKTISRDATEIMEVMYCTDVSMLVRVKHKTKGMLFAMKIFSLAKVCYMQQR